MNTLCFATNNPNKLHEISKLLNSKFEIKGLQDISCEEELPEDQKTLEGNSFQKAEYVNINYNVDCFADDTGLEVYALNGEPGVYSARYAGDQRNNEDNIRLLLEKLKDKKERRAQFRTVITLIIDGKTRQFEGAVKGEIVKTKLGNEGFGYDPVFVPDGYDCTFAQMTMEQKNEISHRGKAVAKLVDYLSRL